MSASLPLLYSFRRCPYAIRARMVLRYAGIQCVLREVLLRNKPQAMLDISQKGTVPVLQLADQVLDESLDVMQWALSKSDPEGWAVPDEHLLVERNDGYFKYYLDRYKYFDRYPEQPQDWYFDQALVFLQELEVRLQSHPGGPLFLTGKQLCWIDVAIFPFVRQFAFVDKEKFDAQALPGLQQWLDYFLESDLFLSVMNKYPFWAEGDPLTVFPAVQL